MSIFDNATEEPVRIGKLTDDDWKDVYGEDEEEQPTPEPPTSETFLNETKPPDRSGSRVSGEGVLTTVWMGIGSVLVSKQIDPPVGRCLQLEAPLAAREIDKAIAGTFLDRILQPLFRKGDQLEGLGAIIALPVMVGLYERKPQMAMMLEEPMKQVMENVLLDVAPLMRTEKSKLRRSARSMADIHEAFNVPLNVPDPKDPTGRKKVKVDPASFIYENWVFQDAANLEPEPEA